MKTSEASFLIIPGWGGSGEDHWQSRWESKLATARRVAQEDWERPSLHRWVGAIVESMIEAPLPVVLVAHSLGVPSAVHAVHHVQSSLPHHRNKLRGAILVTSPSEEAILREAAIDPAFAPYPRRPLPCPSLLVASRNDAYCDYETANAYAQAWGATLIDAGESGHINVASGHGPWPEGLLLLARLMKQI